MIKFTLYENAIDSFTHGINHLEDASKNDSKTDYKHSILLIFQGTELLLKSLLSQINVIYIFDKNSLYDKCHDPLNPTLDELLECKSLEINKLCKEVQKYYQESFPKNSLKAVESMAKVRNQIQHFGIVIEKRELMVRLEKLYRDVISKTIKLLGELITYEENKPLKEELNKIFCFFHNATIEEKMLKLLGEDFSRGTCIKCNNHSLFIFYSSYGYPENIYCSCCDFEVKNIEIDDFRVCPECDVNSLIYLEEYREGICTWYKCSNHKDGGIPVEMYPCETCNGYVIEGSCSCGYEE